MKYFNYLDLFSGIGGFSLGFQQAGWKFEKTYHSEIDKYARSIYEKHFPKSVGLGDIRKIRPEELGNVDLVTFGFPCQDLSSAGKRAGMEGSRSNLFFEAMRIIRQLRPSIFIFENVKGLFSSNEGKDFELVLREIADIGIYECEWQLLNTSWFLPQSRERIYFIGYHRKEGGQKIFPIGESNGNNNESKGKSKIDIIYKNKTGKVKQGYSQTGSIFGIDGIAPTIDNANSRLYKVHNMMPRSSKSGKGGTGHLMRQDGKVYNIDTGLTNVVEITSSQIRHLTPTECERLQGFPDGWTEGISDTQRYKTLGNAVSVPVVKCIAEKLPLDKK